MDGSRAHEREVAVDEGVHTQPATIEIMTGRLGHDPLRVCSSETVVFFRIFRWLIHAAAPIIAFEQWPYNLERCGAVQVAGAPPVWRGLPNLGRGRRPRDFTAARSGTRTTAQRWPRMGCARAPPSGSPRLAAPTRRSPP